MPKSLYLSNNLLNHVLRSTAYSAPSATYVGLYTVAPSPAGGGVEVSGGGYARQAVSWTAPSTGSIANTTEVSFPVATADWGTLVAFAVFDAAVAGHMLYFANLNASRIVTINDQVIYPVGQLVVTEA